MRDYFFSPAFKVDFSWRGKALRLGSILPASRRQISDGLKEMSSTSIRNRFLGSKKDFTEKELEYLTHLDGINHYALGIEEQFGSRRGVAVIRLVRSSDRPHEAEVAVTIIDEYQRMGLGVLLMKLIMLAAAERKIHRLTFTFLPQNEGILALIRKIGNPKLLESNPDAVQYALDIDDVSSENIVNKIEKLVGR